MVARVRFKEGDMMILLHIYAVLPSMSHPPALLSCRCRPQADSAGVGTAIAPFPIAGIIPKDATQAEDFLREYPTWDGRGIIVAVFDTGVGTFVKCSGGNAVCWALRAAFVDALLYAQLGSFCAVPVALL